MISFIVPFLNEEKFIIATVQEILKSCDLAKINDYEILLIDDCSTDDSVNLIKRFSEKNDFKINLINNSKNLGFGGSIKVGIKNSSKNYLMWIPGDNAYNFKELYKIIKHVGNYDIISSKYADPNARSKFRNIFTKSYTPLLNFVFNLNLPYYCGLILCRQDIAKNINIETDSHFFQVEFWVKSFLLKKGLSFQFEPLNVWDKSRGANSFKIKNSIKVIFNFFKLLGIVLISRIKK